MRVSDLAQPIGAGLVGAVTGFASSFALVVAGLQAVGATPADAASGLLALCLLQGVLAIGLGLRYRMPLAFAWSTPGAALLVAAQATTGDYRAAVGAFLLCGVLLVVTGLWPALARAMTRIPRPIASAMLAGILFPICLAPVFAAVQLPALALPVVIVWLLLARLAPRWAVPGAVFATIVAVVVSGEGADLTTASLWPTVTLTWPSFDPLVLVSLGLPLYVVTMAGQNVPGFAVLTTFGYPHPPARAILVGTGAATAVGSVFGGFTLNLAAITAALMAGPDAHPDRDRRWIASVTGGVAYLVIGLGAGAATVLVAVTPPILITAVAGLALFGAFAGAATGALEEASTRIVAVVTFLVVASGVTIAGIGSAFWGLVVGGIAMLWLVRRPRGAGAVGGRP
ncbi:benzoate/H(+) symporter BenE family transporter [Protaetiibacter mangrovi]|uniref:Benzoate/H(+) symporter BenE family transporter n=1 Tax=Protaetiibacter mangrovi TaxID=2970926 RepID=A0ABT1ZEJ9_9MICO|nr:benzoate/H(+) symporter BenE family transporter [Protaetiibacter mangrovi]MCS0499132.1 benzoate/H(+) symporter BenE family transporter [Protaetiibacter mangrovi]TPX04767.1 benzoate/H(+) symporter BenE family transporter [Schumannella luteola]